MAPLRSKTTVPVGSASWVSAERNSALQFMQQEVEEFSFSARNEMEWLNEHMADIFSKTQKSITDIFKTPGKLRGKTPRTIRRRNAPEARAPLTDIFAPNLEASSNSVQRTTRSHKGPSPLKLMEIVSQTTREKPAGRRNRSSHAEKENIDSGYHGSEEGIDTQQTSTESFAPSLSAQNGFVTANSQESLTTDHTNTNETSRGTRTTEESYYSAKIAPESDKSLEVKASCDTSRGFNSPPAGTNVATTVPSESQVLSVQANAFGPEPAPRYSAVSHDIQPTEESPLSGTHSQLENTRSPSDGSSPVHPAVRKSSLSFAALPAREPLGSKASIDARASRTSHLELSMVHGGGQAALSGRQVGNLSVRASQSGPIAAIDEADHSVPKHHEKPGLVSTGSDSDLTITQLHRKTSTQRLHERISQLGQSQPARPTKSIPSILQQASLSDVPGSPRALDVGAVRTSSEHLLSGAQAGDIKGLNDDDDDWIPPPRVPDAPLPRPSAKSLKSVDDGPLSASKAKLSSILKSARGIFASSAGVSAQAKMETLSPATMTLRSQGGRSAIGAEPGATLDKQTGGLDSTTGNAERRAPLPPDSARIKTTEEFTRKTRSSTEKEQRRMANENNDRIDIAAEHEDLLYSEPPEAASPMLVIDRSIRPQGLERTESDSVPEELVEQPRRQSQRKRKSSDEDARLEMEHPAKVIIAGRNGAKSADTGASRAQSQAPQQNTKSIGRPAKPGKAPVSKNKPVPVAIKVGTASQRELDHRKVNPPNAALASTLQQSLAPPAVSAKQGGPQTKPLATTLRKVTSSASLKGSVSSQPAKPKALAAAARKKEQDEREAQRKLDAKRELERKKLVQQEEERKKEQQRREMELQRQREQPPPVDDAKKAAQKQAIERRRLENARKQEQQRNGTVPARARHGNDLASAIQQEKGQMQMTAPPPRGELNNARPVSKFTPAVNVPGPSEELNRVNVQPQINPARPPKRVAQVEVTDERAYGGPTRVTATYMQVESKRRKTNGEDEVLEPRQGMPPPMRQSTLRKEIQNKPALTPGFMNTPMAQAGPVHGGSSLFKSTTLAQHHLQHPQAAKTGGPHHPDMGRFANAKIPFAESHGNSAVPSTIQKVGSSRAGPSSSTNMPAKSSPQYQDGDGIDLPEIPTDSDEESDDDYGRPKEFAVPDWAQSPALRELLAAQQLMDPEEVFGPMAPLHMEEIFRANGNGNNGNGNRERQAARFRNRTSSANWSGPDRLTEEEIQRDLEARRRLMIEGEWKIDL